MFPMPDADSMFTVPGNEAEAEAEVRLQKLREAATMAPLQGMFQRRAAAAAAVAEVPARPVPSGVVTATPGTTACPLPPDERGWRSRVQARSSGSSERYLAFQPQGGLSIQL